MWASISYGKRSSRRSRGASPADRLASTMTVSANSSPREDTSLRRNEGRRASGTTAVTLTAHGVVLRSSSSSSARRWCR